MTKKKKIAIYSGEIPSTTFIERLIVGLSKSGPTILLFGILKSKVHYNKDVHVHGHPCGKISKLFYLAYYSLLLFVFKYSQKKKLDVYLKKTGKADLHSKVKFYPVLWYQPDIFHIQWAKGLADWMWVKDFNMKIVLSLRGAHINYSPITDPNLAEMYRDNFPRVDAFHAVSEAIGMEAQKYGADSEKITVVKSGLNFLEFPFQLKSTLPHNHLKIVSVGRNHWKKNYKMALDVMSILKTKGFPFKYEIIGIDDDEALLFQRSQLKLDEFVSFTPSVSIEQVKKSIVAADMLLLPSLEEGIANVVLEAMALGTLVISTDCGGMSEVIISGETGFLVPMRDVNAMAETIITASELSGNAYQQILLKARELVEQNHSIDGMISKMISLYEC